jgi:hypothetical protein
MNLWFILLKFTDEECNATQEFFPQTRALALIPNTLINNMNEKLECG